MSLGDDWLKPDEKKIYEDHKSEFRSGLDNIKTPDQLKSSDYGLFFASAGHAALIDYPEAKGIQKIVADIWEAGGIVSAVCHVSRQSGWRMGEDTSCASGETLTPSVCSTV